MAIGINAALHGDDKYRWFIDWLKRGIFWNTGIPLFINYLKLKIMFYKKLFIWLFWLIIALFTGCLPLILIILCIPSFIKQEAEKPPVKWMNNSRPVKRRYERYENEIKKWMCSNKSVQVAVSYTHLDVYKRQNHGWLTKQVSAFQCSIMNWITFQMYIFLASNSL